MPLLGMISCGALEICNFRHRNPSSATNVSNITGGSKKCVGLARVIRRPTLRAREFSRPTEQHDPHFLHKPDTFPLGTHRLPERWCSLEAASNEAYWKRVQTSTTTYRGHVTTPCQLPRIFGIVWFSEDLNGSIRQAAEVISPLGVRACPSLIRTRPTHVAKTPHRIFHAASRHDFMWGLADLQFPAQKP
jgi:hypothetical protein